MVPSQIHRIFLFSSLRRIYTSGMTTFVLVFLPLYRGIRGTTETLRLEIIHTYILQPHQLFIQCHNPIVEDQRM